MAFGDNQLWRPEIVPPQAPDNQLAPQPTWADAADYAADWMRQQQAISEQRGLWDPQTGLPTQAGIAHAAMNTAFGLGTGDLSLERVGAWSGATGSAKHSYLMKDAKGNYVGGVDTTFDPVTKDLRIEDVRADDGPASLGSGAVVSLRDQLRQLYPEAETLSGHRITGANPDRQLRRDFPALEPPPPVSGARAPLLDNPAFAKWFGNSRIVDEAGQPLVVYHGSGADIPQFDPGRAGATGNVTTQWGSFFSPSPEAASLYATDFHRSGQNVTPAYLAVENPYEMTRGEWNQHAMTVRRGQMTPDEALTAAQQFKQKLQDAGHDGIVVKGEDGFPDEYVAFHPTQIKSAVGNRGTFDPRDPRINYGVAGLMAGGLGAAATAPQQ